MWSNQEPRAAVRRGSMGGRRRSAASRARLACELVTCAVLVASSTAVLAGPAGASPSSPSAATSTGAHPGATPPLEPIGVRRLPLAAGFSAELQPDWLPDGRHIVLAFDAPDQPHAQLAVATSGGTHVHCLTCGLDTATISGPQSSGSTVGFGKPFAFGDAKRILTTLEAQAGSPNSASQNFEYAILQCSPSVVDCKQRTLSKLDLPASGPVQNREARISPDGRWLAWTQLRSDGTVMALGRLVRHGSSYGLTDVRVVNPDLPLGSASPAWIADSPYAEIKRFSSDGQSLYYATMADAENFDVWRLDLRTGKRTRVTTQDAWDEDVSDSPNGSSLLLYSSRGLNRMTVFDQLPRPPFVDPVLFTWVGRFELDTVNRHCLLEPWLLGARGQQGTYFGQPVDPAPPAGWDARTAGEWSPNGTQLLAWEDRGTSVGTPARPAAHIIVATLPARRPHVPPVERTPDPTWAPSFSSFHGYLGRTGTFVVHGQESGTATITMSGNAFSGAWSVRYDHYSDDNKSFLDGTEAVTEPSILTQATWQATLRLTGSRSGSLDANLTIAKGGVTSGTVTSTYDGSTASGLPPSTCPSLPRPQLIAHPTVRSGLVSVRVTARVTQDPVPRPVRDATVRIGGRTARTGPTGVAHLQGAAGDRVGVGAAGFLPAEAVVPG